MQALSGIYASSSTDDYAVGENAEVYRLTGSAWEYKGHNKLVSSYSDVNVSSVNIPRFTNLGKVYTLSKRVTDGIYFSTAQQLSWIIRMKGNKYDAVSNNPSPCSAQGNTHPSSLRGKA